ncbi:hypothetical protein CK203_021196 [Vitis vinifera]|uniref:Uncharacterized protein n=1 Tax=Vitis vinifera TaxID=29760 RepID=A0A438IMK7_VITVI|nr:hypothetical protein CK203_021196 [Vitis vinifera]
MGSATTERLIPLAATLISLILIHSTPAISSLASQLHMREIEEIVRREDDLVFSMRISSYVFPIDYFEERPQCQCVLKCGGGQASKET